TSQAIPLFQTRPSQGRSVVASNTSSRRALLNTYKRHGDDGESYTATQAKTGRPLSPHVEIYDFPAAALSSITNRVTGVALTVGLYGIGGAALVGCDPAAMMSALGSSLAGPAVKGAVAFPLVFHYLGAARHTVWDYMPETLQNSGVKKTSYALFGLSGVITLGLMAV
ncbi:unnamed protein product, partial [Ascophyllum nodosum]